MNQPQPTDPSAPTRPIPIVVPPGPAPQVPAGTSGPPYVHRFGNVPAYLIGRFCALLIDAAVIPFAIATAGFHEFESGFLSVAGRTEGGFLALAGWSFGIAFAFAYLCEAIFGTTLGKALFALQTRRTDGRHAGPVRVFVRYLLRPLDALLIGPLLAMVTPRHRTLGDLAGGTVVSRNRIGVFAPLIGAVLLGGIAYAQIVYGGGLTSAIEVAAETSNFAPEVIAKAAHAVGLAAAPLPIVAEPATPAPATTSEPVPVSQSTDSADEPQPSDESQPSDEPEAEPTGRIINQ